MKPTIFITALFASSCVFADNGFRTDITIEQWCHKFSAEYFWQAFHPGKGNRQKVYRGTLNEVTPGRGAECQLRDGQLLGGNFFVHGGSLTNSQWGHTVVAAVGYQKTLVDERGLAVTARLELAHLEYGVPRHNFQVVRGYVPLPSVQVTYDFSSLPKEVGMLRKVGTFGVRQYFLPVGNITLTSMIWQIPF